MSKTPIGPGTRVTLHFRLSLATGEEIDSTGDSPADFDVGDGRLPPGFEQALFGLCAGDERVMPIPAAQAFGPWNEENVQQIKRNLFDPSIELEAGLVVSFADVQQTELPGVVGSFDDEVVEVDFNHPLAGRDVTFEVEILDVAQVSNEIARSG